MFSHISQAPARSTPDIPRNDASRSLPQVARPRSLSEGLESFSSVSEYLRITELIERAAARQDDVESLCSRLQVPEMRDKILPVLIHRAALMNAPLKQMPVLTSLLQFADEGFVREYALKSLESCGFAECPGVLAAASRILVAAATSLEPRQIKRIALVAGKLGAKDETLAASAAQYVLYQLPASSSLSASAISLAHEWFLARKSGENPWLRILSRYPSRENFEFLREIVRGTVPHSKEPSVFALLLKGSLHLHSTAAMAGTVGVVLNKALAIAGLMGRVTSIQAFCISAGLLYLGKAARQAVFDSMANCRRGFERVEAVAHISLIHERARKERGGINTKLTEETSSFLFDISNDPSQEPSVRKAAYKAHVTAYQPSELWGEVSNAQA